MQAAQYPPDSGPFASLSEGEKKKRLDAMVRIWQSDSECYLAREGYQAFVKSTGLDEYHYSVWLRFPEWKRSAVVGQVVTLRKDKPEAPVLFSMWRSDPLLKTMPDWKVRLPNETVLNITVHITPGGLGEGSKWAIGMPREMIPRYKSGWPTQQEWVSWTRSFDWLSIAVSFIRAMLDSVKA